MKQFKRTLESYKIKHEGLTPYEVRVRAFAKIVANALQWRANMLNSRLAKAGILSRIKAFAITERNPIDELTFKETN